MAGDSSANARRVKQDASSSRGFIPGTVDFLARIYSYSFADSLRAPEVFFNCLNKFNKPKPVQSYLLLCLLPQRNC
jgi:hypothetical protein